VRFADAFITTFVKNDTWIVTVLNAANLKVLVVLGVLHQFVAILVVMALTTLLFLVTQKKTTAAPV